VGDTPWERHYLRHDERHYRTMRGTSWLAGVLCYFGEVRSFRSYLGVSCVFLVCLMKVVLCWEHEKGEQCFV